MCIIFDLWAYCFVYLSEYFWIDKEQEEHNLKMASRDKATNQIEDYRRRNKVRTFDFFILY